MLIESVVIFSTPSHLLETIYAIQIGDIPYISNSLAFLLERSGSNLDHEYFDYQLDMCSSMFGPENQIGSSPLKDNRRLMYYRCCNISVEEDLKIVKEDKHSNLVFSDYASYRNEISGVIDRVSQNATSASRKKIWHYFYNIKWIRCRCHFSAST